MELPFLLDGLQLSLVTDNAKSHVKDDDDETIESIHLPRRSNSMPVPNTNRYSNNIHGCHRSRSRKARQSRSMPSKPKLNRWDSLASNDTSLTKADRWESLPHSKQTSGSTKPPCLPRRTNQYDDGICDQLTLTKLCISTNLIRNRHRRSISDSITCLTRDHTRYGKKRTTLDIVNEALAETEKLF